MLYAIIAVAALILDQAVKYWTSAHIVLNTGTKELIPGFIHLANVHNEGAAFSFMEGARWFFVVLCVVFVAAVIVLLAKNVINTPVARWMCVFVLAGAVGNCIDRVIAGYVVDMFEFSFRIFGSAFPVFNVADIFIVVGGIGFCLCVLLEKEPVKAENAPVRASYAAPVQKKAVQEQPSRPAPRAQRSEKRPSPVYTAPKAAPEDEDPFSRWERTAAPAVPGKSPAAAPAAQSSPAAKSAPARQSTVQHIAPAAAPSVKKTAAPAPAQASNNKIEYAGRHAAPEAAPARPASPVQRPAAPKAEPVKASPKSDEPSYDLEDILAEFRDL